VETGTMRRGIEAFSEIDVSPPVWKGKGRKKRNRALEQLISPATLELPNGSKWDTGKQDVEFIATRTGRSTKEVGSLYHKNGASIRATILAILDAQAALEIECDDPLIESSAIDLGHEFPTLPRHLLLAMVQVTHSSTAKSHELAKALVHQPTSTKPNILIELRHAPLELHATSPKSKTSATSNLGLTLDTATRLTKSTPKSAKMHLRKHGLRTEKGNPITLWEE